MRVLGLSDSHGDLAFMRRAVELIRPHGIIHLGDHYEDGERLGREFPHLPLWQVAGNCDRAGLFGHPEQLCPEIFGARVYLTHGHREGVKLGLGGLLRRAREQGVQAALFGHTHQALCQREEDGLWVLNPGTGSFWPRTAAVMVIENGQVCACRLLEGIT